jgi:hypothetical protein
MAPYGLRYVAGKSFNQTSVIATSFCNRTASWLNTRLIGSVKKPFQKDRLIASTWMWSNAEGRSSWRKDERLY